MLFFSVTYRWKVIDIHQERKMVPFQRYGHTAVAFGPLVYVWGGRNDNTACNILYCFDTSKHFLVQRGIKSSLIWSNWTLCVFASYIVSMKLVNVKLFLLTDTHQWSVPEVKGLVPEARDGHSACIVNDHMYIFSGYLEYVQSYTQEVHTLNLRTMTWSYVRTTVSLYLSVRHFFN